MKHRKFGSTGIEISEIVFGAGAVGGIVFQPERGARLEAVRRALDLGINWIDTAPSYGDGRSEENLGWILKEVDGAPYVSTKVRIGEEHIADIPGEIQRSLEGSLGRLQRDSVDLIQLHTSITRERGTFRGSISVEDVLGPGGVIKGFARLRQQGLARYVGFTAFGDTESLHTVVRSGRFDSVQAYFNLLNPSAGRAMPAGFTAHDYGNLIGLAHENGMGVLNIRVLAAGAIAGQPPPGAGGGISPGSEADADLQRGARVRDALGDQQGTMAQAAIRYALMNSGISGVLVGFSRGSHIDEAVAAQEMGPLSVEALAKLDALYATDFKDA
jgi:aryl-alcohol dehydrogenase-like predicted oxidoreductase